METRVTPVHVLTFATHQKGTLPTLVERAKAGGFKPKIIGMGSKWRGFGWRLKSYHQQILKMLREEGKQGGMKPNDLVVLVDGYDVIPLGTASNFVDGFQRYHTDVLISAESNCTPYMLPSGTDPFKVYLPHCRDTPFINAGMIGGKAHALASFLGDLIQSRKVQDDDDDQAAITQYYLEQLRRHKKRREDASLPPLREADHPVVCVVESSSFGSLEKSDDLDLDLARPELSKTSLTIIKVCLDTNCQVFQNSEFNEAFLEPCSQMGLYGRYLNKRTRTYPCFIHLPGKPALLNLTRVLECKSLFDPRELLEAICKGLIMEKISLGKGAQDKKEAPSPIASQTESTSEQEVVNLTVETIEKVDNPAPETKQDKEDTPSKTEEQDPIEALETFVVKYGEEASAHIGAGMRIFSHRMLLPYQGIGASQ
jgi:hypothetical protein